MKEGTKPNVILTYPEDKDIYQGAVSVYQFPLSVQIPTCKLAPHNFLSDLFGNKYRGAIFNPSEDPIIISPNGGLAKKEYFKLIKDLKVDDPNGGGCFMGKDDNGNHIYKHTAEDAVRFWMLERPEFMDELKAQGWTIFEKPSQLGEFYKKELGLEEYTGYLKKDISLVNALEVLSKLEGPTYEFFLDELKDLSGKVPEIEYIYGNNVSSAFGRAKINYCGKSLEIRIKGFEKIDLSENRVPSGEKQTGLQKTVKLGVAFDQHGFSEFNPAWWTEEMTQRVRLLTEEYSNDKKILISTPPCSNNCFNVDISNRRSFEKETNIDTQTLLDQAVSLEGVVRKLIELEHQDHETKEEAILEQRREGMYNESQKII